MNRFQGKKEGQETGKKKKRERSGLCPHIEKTFFWKKESGQRKWSAGGLLAAGKNQRTNTVQTKKSG
jgi:hypothetical protein